MSTRSCILRLRRASQSQQPDRARIRALCRLGLALRQSDAGQARPGAARGRWLSSDLNQDEVALRRFIDTAEHRRRSLPGEDDLEAAVLNSASTFGAIASEREALADFLDRTPSVLTQARGTLDVAGTTLTKLRPTLREVPAAANRARTLLPRLTRAERRARPVLAQLRGQLPDLRSSLNAVPPIEEDWVQSFQSLAELKDVQEIARALRIYGVDFMVGVPNGLAGLAVGNYNDYGHYARLEYVQNFQTSLSGRLAPS